MSKSLVFLFIGRFLFTVFYPGKNVQTPTSPLYMRIEKPFALLVTNLNGLFSKISLRIDQTYTKEKYFLQHGFSENGGVQTFDSLKRFE